MTVDVFDFHRRAVSTPSHDDVSAMRDLLVETLAGEGVDPEVDEAGNVVATRGEGDPHLVLNTHVDTVPPHVPYQRRSTVPTGEGAQGRTGTTPRARPENRTGALFAAAGPVTPRVRWRRWSGPSLRAIQRAA